MTKDRQRRGEDLARRRLAHKLSVLALSKDSGVARATIDKAEAGTASTDSLERLEAFFSELDQTTGLDTSEPQTPATTAPELPEMVEFDVSGPRVAWHVVVRGPADMADELRHQAVELLREWEADQPDR